MLGKRLGGGPLLTGKTKVLGLLGWPVGHSVSPAMQNAALASLGLDYVYVPFNVAPADLAQAVRGLAVLGVRGANVTIPHKEAVLPLVERLTPEAQAVGAVNTLVREKGGWVGHNTDGEGFLEALREEANFALEGKRLLLLGAGGAARAVAFAAAGAGVSLLLIANRTPARAHTLAEALARRFPCRVRAIPLERGSLAAALAETDVLVNTLPLGMYPQVEAMPPLPPEALEPPLLVCDLIYNPRPTKLLSLAASRGCRTLDGLPMLVAQGALAFALWTGCKAPKEIMRRAAEAALAARQGEPRLGGAEEEGARD